MASFLPWSIETNYTKISTDISNTITQDQQTNCISTIETNVDNNTIIVNGSVIDGNFIGVTYNAYSDASCQITASLDDYISNLITNLSSQKNTVNGTLFGDGQNNFQTNITDISNNLANNITQINESLCSSNLLQSIQGNYIYVTDSTIKGNFLGVYGTGSNSQATCIMDNYIKNAVYNQVQSNASESNSDLGIFAGLFGIIEIIGIIAAVGAIIIAVVGSISATIIKTRKPKVKELTASDIKNYVELQEFKNYQKEVLQKK